MLALVLQANEAQPEERQPEMPGPQEPAAGGCNSYTELAQLPGILLRIRAVLGRLPARTAWGLSVRTTALESKFIASIINLGWVYARGGRGQALVVPWAIKMDQICWQAAYGRGLLA